MSYQTRFDKDEINALRRNLGLPELKEGKVYCLKCGEEFFSTDLKNNRICIRCSNIKIASSAIV